MATFTSRLGLRKPDPTDKPNRTTDLSDNFDGIDDAVHSTVIADSTARPTSTEAWQGRRIFEEDSKHHLIESVDESATGWVHPSVPVISNWGTETVQESTDLIAFGIDTDEWLMRYKGAPTNAWKEMFSAGRNDISGRIREAAYINNSVQTLTSNALFQVAYPTAVYTSPDVTVNGAGTIWTIQRAGMWIVQCGLRVTGSNANNREHLLGIRVNGTNYITQHRAQPFTVPMTFNCYTRRRFDVGDQIDVIAMQNGVVGSKGTEPAFGYDRISFAWLRP